MSERLDQYQVIMINTEQEAIFAQKIITDTVVLTYNKDYSAVNVDGKTIFIYPHTIALPHIIRILSNPKITKLISKPDSAVKIFFKLSSCQSCMHISTYVNKKIARKVPEMNREIMDQYQIKDLSIRAANVTAIMMKYKLETDKVTKQRKRSFFNMKRECYLLYLSVYNDILITHGPMKFVDLTTRVINYTDLCQIDLPPSMALNALISVGALINDEKTSMVSIPDQI